MWFEWFGGVVLMGLEVCYLPCWCGMMMLLVGFCGSEVVWLRESRYWEHLLRSM